MSWLLQKTVKNNNIDNATKKIELEMAVCVACRCAVLSVDHFNEIITRNSQGSVMVLHLLVVNCIS